ncbi:hypothetical protein ACH4U6_34400 [Streptomyces netropsis]|uniref:hypothetical protein n=1 Tax=Streptomyces netropsis TaxID=55404 RepID=UPI0037B43D57
MLGYRTLRDANLAALEAAVEAWQALPKRIQGVGDKFGHEVENPLYASDWEGETATACLRNLARTRTELLAAAEEARDVHTVLDHALGRFRAARRTLDHVAEAVARDKHLKQNDDGRVYAETGSSALTKGYQETVTAHNEAVAQALRSATEADDDLHWALLQDPNGSRDPGFNQDGYDRTGRRQAEKDARRALELTAKGSDMSDAELTRLDALLGAHRNDPLFGERIATSLGPQGVLRFWADMADPQQVGPGRGRADLLRGLQESLGVTLASATRVDSTAMDSWKTGVIEAGGKRIGTDAAGNPWGFHVMSNLMRHGEYDGKFLTAYGNALVRMDKKVNSGDLSFWTNPANTADLTYQGGKNDRGQDPMTGFLQALGHSPEGAAEFFRQPAGVSGPVDKESEVNKNLWYLTKERHWHPDVTFTGDSGRIAGYNALGHALESATTGSPYDAATGTDRRSGASARVMEQVAYVYGDDNSLIHRQSGIADSLGRMGAAYIDDINYAVSGIGDHGVGQDAVAFPARYEGGRAEFGRYGAIGFLSTLGQHETAHGYVSRAEHVHTLSALDANPATDEAGYVRGRSALLAEAEVRGILDHARVEQAAADHAHDAEENNKSLARSTEWKKWVVGATIGAGVAVLPVPGAAAVGVSVVPLAGETAGGMVSTYVGQRFDRAAEAVEMKPDEAVKVDENQFYRAGESDIADTYHAYLRNRKDFQQRVSDAALAQDIKTRYGGSGADTDGHLGHAPHEKD